METFNSFTELAIANGTPPYTPLHLQDAESACIAGTDNMTPTGVGSFANKLDKGRYRFMEMSSNGISYRVAAIDVNDPSNKPAYIFDNFINEQDAMQKLNAARNIPGCTWSGPDPSRIIQVEDYKKGAIYEDLD